MLEIKLNCVFDATDNLLSAIKSLTGGHQVPGETLTVEPARAAAPETPREIAPAGEVKPEPEPAPAPVATEVEEKPAAPEKATAPREKATAPREKARTRAKAARETAPPAATTAPEEARDDEKATPPRVVATPPPVNAKGGETVGPAFGDLSPYEQLELIKELASRVAKAGKVKEIRYLLDALGSERASALDPSDYQTFHGWLNRLDAGERVEVIVKSIP